MIDDCDTAIIDVREKGEQPFVDDFKHIQIPLSELINNQSLITNDNVIVFCQSGKRSLQAAKMLSDLFKDKNVFSLKAGIVEWKKRHAAYNQTT